MVTKPGVQIWNHLGVHIFLTLPENNNSSPINNIRFVKFSSRISSDSEFCKQIGSLKVWHFSSQLTIRPQNVRFVSCGVGLKEHMIGIFYLEERDLQ